MPVTVAERDQLAAILRKLDSADLVAVTRLFFDTYVITEMTFDARRVLANFTAAGTGWNDVPSSTSPAWKAIQIAFLRSVEELFLPYLPRVLGAVDAPAAPPPPPPSVYAVVDDMAPAERRGASTPMTSAPHLTVVENDDPIGDTENGEAA
jgi:hypothetical protein